MTQNTQIWFNTQNGHHFAIGPNGAMTLNGAATGAVPAWSVGRGPDAVYGPLMPWNGGDCPLPHETLVRAIFRGRRPYMGPAIWPELPERGKAVMWAHAPAPMRPDPANDIVGYQVRLA